MDIRSTGGFYLKLLFLLVACHFSCFPCAFAALSSGDDVEPGQLGLALRPLTGDERARAKIDQGGLLVEGVEGPSARAGLAPGDVLLAINGQAVSSLDQVRNVLSKKPKSVALLVERRGERIFVPVNLG